MSPSAKLRALQGVAVFAAIVTIGLKSAAYALTGSVGLLSDALESGINLVAALAAYASLSYSSRPADPTHTFGHEKIEFFSSGIEGALVFCAGLATIAYAVGQLWNPTPLEHLGVGVVLAAAASVVNLVVGWLLLRVGRRAGSLLTEASGHHLMSDVLTSVGVMVGLGLVRFTGIVQLDGLIAILVGGHILGTGFSLVRRSFDGLMDHAWAKEEIEAFRLLVRTALPPRTDFHLLKTRRAGRRLFAEFHLVVAGERTVRESHADCHELERTLMRAMPELVLSVHVEPNDERDSWELDELQRLGEVLPPEVPPGAADDEGKP